jgi:hypothetical protein
MSKQLDVALLIGIEHYADHRLEPCGGIRNADAVEAWFFQSCQAIGSLPWVVRIHSGSGKATQANIIDKIAEVCDKCPGPGSRLLFYFSGHGATDSSNDALLLCEDTGVSGILLRTVTDYFGFFEFDKQVFVIDACRVLDDTLIGSSVFTRKKIDPARKMHIHQRMMLHSTLPSYEAYADRKCVLDPAGGLTPCAYFTRGLLEIAHGTLTKGYRWIPEMSAMAIRADRVRKTMEGYLTIHKQLPVIYDPFGELQPWYCPLFFVRLPKLADMRTEESLFDAADPEEEALLYRQFVRALLAKLGGFETQHSQIFDDVVGKAKCGAFYLAPLDKPSVNWTVKYALFGERYPEAEVRPIDLSADGVIPNLASFFDMILKLFGTDGRHGELLGALTCPTVLYVVLEESTAEAVATQILEEFWKPLAEQCGGSSNPFYLLLTTSNAHARPRVEDFPGVKMLSPPAPVSTDTVRSWIERFRHELPLPIVQDRNARALKLTVDEPTWAGVIERICQELEVDSQWMN